ncbi:hypothetical protein JCGZ_18766 [Jatropha curcas]|uniref:Exostosin GT47 domain-containing protein n=1 Tax=Jatropha curcas TaxID=180498 RepID=A0A067KDR2_JATCU|nr:hypothetical protein JCGZ_18766 [Jatropha curcas]
MRNPFHQPSLQLYAFFILCIITLSSIRASHSLCLGDICRWPRVPSEIYGEVFHSPRAFEKDYNYMKRNLKIFVYPIDGYCHDPIRHFGFEHAKFEPMHYTERTFFNNLVDSQFFTANPDQAHLFFIPINCLQGANMRDTIQDFVQSLILKYPYWNRTSGADHFFVACHDTHVKATEAIPLLKNSIRVVCSPSSDAEYIPGKDVSLQHIQPFLSPSGGKGVENRTFLGFWVGTVDSILRRGLVSLWNADNVLHIQNNHMGKNGSKQIIYGFGHEKFYWSKFCICPRAFGPYASQLVATRIALSIHYGCVPVILDENFAPPFSDILNWQKFSVMLEKRNVHNLKEILQRIPDDEYEALQKNTVEVNKPEMTA